MRILIAHNYYQIPGGEDAVAHAETELLKASGEDTVTYQRHNDELSGLGVVQKISHFSSLDNSRASYREFRNLLQKTRPSVAHFHNIFYMMTPAVYRACRDEGVAVVQSLHNFRMTCSNGLFFRDGHVCEDCMHKNFWEGVKHRCLRKSLPMSLVMASALDRLWRRGTWLNDVDVYVAATEFTKSKFVERGIPSERIAVKPHFVYPEPEPRRKQGDYALFLGRLSEEKGIGVLLEAWRSLKDHHLKVVGTGPLETSLRRTADAEGMNVAFAGLIPPEECVEYIRNARVVVVPSVCYETFGRAVIEAFAVGVPVVASRLGSLAEIVEDGRTGRLTEPGNAAGLSRAIRWFFDNPAESSRMGDEALATFRLKYSAQANYPQLMSIYRQAIALSKEKKTA
jgi:glycosyltransferase involved in cell wall biosynthesis